MSDSQVVSDSQKTDSQSVTDSQTSGADSQEFCEGSGGFLGEQEPVAGQQTTNTDNIIYFPYKTKNLSSTDLFYIKQLSANSLGQQLKDLNSQLLKLSL